MSDWKNNPKLKNIAPEKLALLEKLALGMKGKSPAETMPLLMAALSSAKAKGLSFTPEEMNLIIELLQGSASKEEAARISKMLKLFHANKNRF